MTAPGWLFDEAAHAGPEHLDPAYVAGYDRKTGFDVTPDLEILPLERTTTLVDLGAGTGILALAASPRCRRVVAVDPSPAMLAALREKAERAGAANVDCVRAGFLTYEHAGEPPDVVYTRNALHHLPDFWKGLALERVGTLLRPGGILRLRDIAYSFEPHEAEAAVEAWLAAAPARPEEGWTRAELEEHLRSEHSTFTWLLEPMLERAGFEIVEAEYAQSRAYAAYTCVRR